MALFMHLWLSCKISFSTRITCKAWSFKFQIGVKSSSNGLKNLDIFLKSKARFLYIITNFCLHFQRTSLEEANKDGRCFFPGAFIPFNLPVFVGTCVNALSKMLDARLVFYNLFTRSFKDLGPWKLYPDRKKNEKKAAPQGTPFHCTIHG